MSAIIGMASIVNNPTDFDVTSLTLELPSSVKMDLKDALMPYLNSVLLSGYETNQTRKVYFMGNTGE